jgi:hypothetical protein
MHAECRWPAQRVNSGQRVSNMQKPLKNRGLTLAVIGREDQFFSVLIRTLRDAAAQSPGYRTRLHTFHETNAENMQQKKKENIESAAQAFMQLTINGVNCHRTLECRVRIAE